MWNVYATITTSTSPFIYHHCNASSLCSAKIPSPHNSMQKYSLSGPYHCITSLLFIFHPPYNSLLFRCLGHLKAFPVACSMHRLPSLSLHLHNAPFITFPLRRLSWFPGTMLPLFRARDPLYCYCQIS